MLTQSGLIHFAQRNHDPLHFQRSHERTHVRPRNRDVQLFQFFVGGVGDNVQFQQRTATQVVDHQRHCFVGTMHDAIDLRDQGPHHFVRRQDFGFGPSRFIVNAQPQFHLVLSNAVGRRPTRDGAGGQCHTHGPHRVRRVSGGLCYFGQ